MTLSRDTAVVLLVLVAIAAGTTLLLIRRREAPPPSPGVSLALARDRAARVSSLQYDVTLRVPSERREAVRGQLTARFDLSDASNALAFDFSQPADHLLRVTVNGHPLTPAIAQGHVVIPYGRLVKGANAVDFEFLAGDESLNRSEDFLYTLFVPARASLAMPCFDQPDLKARWRLALDIPKEWTAVANAREIARATTGDRLSLAFGETEPLPTYLFAFAAGRFNIETAERGGRTFRMFHRENDAQKVARNRDAIFDLHARALAWLEDYTGIPYPFGKFDFVLIPAFQFGGMEHPGAIFYNASSLLLDESATQNQTLARANTISHETSHMWFGDLVTMRWFNDVWMKEVFANVMAAKIVNPSFPAVNHDLRFLMENYPAAYDVDRTDGSNPIRQDLQNLDEAGTLYGAIIYEKAPIVMRQLERLIGADAFRDGLRDYLTAHSFGNADWRDLVHALAKHTPENLDAWSHAWVDEAGRPTITTELAVEKGAISRLTFRQRDASGRGIVWPQALHVVVGLPHGTREFDVTLEGEATVVDAAAGLPAPTWVLPVGQGLGYGLFDLDPVTVEYLASSLSHIGDPLTRGAGLVALWEEMLEGRVPPARVLDELITSVPHETDQLILQQMLDDMRTVFWRLTTAADRPAVASKLEPVLRLGLLRASSSASKAAWFGTLESVATTPVTVGWLEKVWRHQEPIAGLPLSESDEADLACALAVRDVTNAEEILNEQLQRFKNADRKARFVFMMPALARDPAVRTRFFESLRNPANRVHEVWVLDAMRYLDHPLRAATSKSYVRPALDLVQDIQRTGDVFFPKRWADAALAGYQTADVAADVHAFIDALPPGYPTRLRWVVLSSADPLFRAVRLLQHP